MRDSLESTAAPPLRGDEGFNLVELALALLVVGIGVLSVIGLFPKSMHQGTVADGENRMGVAADYILGGIQANALSITNKATWDDLAQFKTAVLADVEEVSVTGINVVPSELPFPPGTPAASAEEWLRYRLDIIAAPSPWTENRQAHLQLWRDRYGSTNAAREFLLEMYYHNPPR